MGCIKKYYQQIIFNIQINQSGENEQRFSLDDFWELKSELDKMKAENKALQRTLTRQRRQIGLYRIRHNLWNKIYLLSSYKLRSRTSRKISQK